MKLPLQISIKISHKHDRGTWYENGCWAKKVFITKKRLKSNLCFQAPPNKKRHHVSPSFSKHKISLQFFIQPRNLLFNAFTWTTLTTELALFPESAGFFSHQILIKSSKIHLSGTPKSSILIGCSIIFTIHFGGFTNPPLFVGLTPWHVFSRRHFRRTAQLSRPFRSHARSHALRNHAHTVDGWNPAPVEVGSLSHYLLGFIHPRWLAGFQPSTVGSMGLVYLPTWMVDFFGINVGKYTLRPMDASWDVH